MIERLMGIASLRNVAILAGLLGAAFVTQSMRIKWKDSRIDKLKTELLEMESSRDTWKFKHGEAVDANQTNLEVITRLQETNQQCVLEKAANEANSKAEAELHQGRIVDLNKKYDELRKKLPKSGCAAATWDDSILERLHQDRVHNEN